MPFSYRILGLLREHDSIDLVSFARNWTIYGSHDLITQSKSTSPTSKIVWETEALNSKWMISFWTPKEPRTGIVWQALKTTSPGKGFVRNGRRKSTPTIHISRQFTNLIHWWPCRHIWYYKKWLLVIGHRMGVAMTKIIILTRFTFSLAGSRPQQ